MTTISQVLDQLHISPPEGTTLVFAQLDGGTMWHATLEQIADAEVEDSKDLYLATGAYPPGAIKTDGTGRSAANVAAVLTVPFDCDLVDFLGVAKDEIIGWDDDEVYSFIADLQKTVIDAFNALNIPYHRIDYTGHGIVVHTYLRDATPDHTRPLMDAHKVLIARLNEHAGFRMIDPARSDPGPGIARFPGTLNVKNPDKPRRVTTLVPFNILARRLTPAEYLALAGTAPREHRPQRLILRADMPASVEDELIDALIPAWNPGRRHATALGLCGLLAKAGVPAEQAAQIITAISAGDDEPWDRLMCVKTTYDKISAGQDVAGYTALQRELGPDLLDFVTQRIDSLKPLPAKPVLLTGKTIGKRDADNDPLVAWEPMPEAAFYGWFGRYRDLMAPTTEASDTFHLACALTLAGAMMGRSVWTEHASERLHGNLFTMLVGKSGTSRKDTAMKRALALVAAANPTPHGFYTAPFAERSGYGSAEKLIEELQEQPNILWKESEATVIFNNMRRESTRTLRDRLIQAWDVPDALANRVRQGGGSIAEKPYLSMLLAIQPGRLADSMSTDDITSGLANRFLFFPASPKKPIASPPRVDLLEASRLYIELHDNIKQYGPDKETLMNPCILPTDEANRKIGDWYLAQPSDDDEDTESMRVRLQLQIRKVSLIFATSCASPVITVAHVDAAIALIEWQWRQVVKMLPTWGSQKESRIENRIVDVLRTYGPYLRKREIQRRCSNPRQWSTLDFNRVFDAMLRNEQIESFRDDEKATVFGLAA
ncbi:MAG: DUF3987 domain-containing protein [Thermomicrobiales bacterium]